MQEPSDKNITEIPGTGTDTGVRFGIGIAPKTGYVDILCECTCTEHKPPFPRFCSVKRMEYSLGIVVIGSKAASKCWRKAAAEYEICSNAVKLDS